MKRGARVTVTLVRAVAAAAVAAGCGSRHGADQSWENCVDADERVVEAQRCADEQPQWRHPNYHPYYHWYYTRGSSPLGIGHPAFGGTLARPGGSAVATPGSGHTVVRGGFGSTGAGHPSSGT